MRLTDCSGGRVGAGEPFQVLVKGSSVGVMTVHGDETVVSLRKRVGAREGPQPVPTLLCDGKPLPSVRATLAEAHVAAGAVLQVRACGLAGGMPAKRTLGKRNADQLKQPRGAAAQKILKASDRGTDGRAPRCSGVSSVRDR